MKKNVLILIFLCLIFGELKAQRYDFPVRPGTEKWGTLITEQDRFYAMQIPEQQLQKISTYDLIETCLNYPAMGYFTAFNSPQDGMDIIIQNFNGLQELLKRKDAPEKLLSLYKQLDEKTLAFPNKAVDKSDWSIKRCYFELLIAQNEIISKMNESLTFELMSEARNRLNQKIENKVEFSIMDYQPTLLIIGRILNKSMGQMLQKSANSEEMNQFIKRGTLESVSIVESIIDLSDSYIKLKNRNYETKNNLF